MKKITFFIFCISSINAFSQPFQIGHTSATFNDASRSRDIPVEIYYPADSAGDDVPVATISSEQFPVLAFGHGFVISWSAYENIWANLVPKGFIMVFPNTETGILPSHPEFGKDLAYVISAMQAMGNAAGIFNGRISNMSAVMGHSMGGGAAFLSAAGDLNISALLTVAPAETNPSAIEAAGTLSIPALVIAGANDCVTPPDTNQIPMYDALQSACKTLITITGASHCQMAENNFLCAIGEATCAPSPAITRDEQHTIINRYISDWLNEKLKGDCSAGQNFNAQIGSDSDITFVKNCSLCELLTVSENVADFASMLPNPFSAQIQISTKTLSQKQVKIYDAFSREVASADFTADYVLNTEKLAAGIYFFTISENQSVLKKGALIKN